MNNLRDTSEELRLIMDGSEQFMSGGHQILKIRRIERKTPAWAKDNKRIQKMLLRAFPKLRTNEKQRLAAGRWVRVIQLYLVMGMTFGEVAAELEITPRKTEFIVRAIYRASRGLRADGTGVLGANKRGRPRKIMP